MVDQPPTSALSREPARRATFAAVEVPALERRHCIAHFAVDDDEVRFCTHLTGKPSWFLPLNRGWEDGAGNPPNRVGLKSSGT